MRILITGGAGFIGSHLTTRCLRAGHTVTVLDDMSAGHVDNLATARREPGLALRVGSASDRQQVDAAVAAADLIYHLAATVGVARAVARPLQVFEQDLAATACVLSAATRHRKALIFASSSEVYGRSRSYPFREDQPLDLPPAAESRWGYARAKAEGERQVLELRAAGALPFAAVVRLFNTVGPRQAAHQGMLLARFREQLRAGEPLTVYGDGAQTRCFVHVEDVVRALLDLPRVAAVDGQVVNLGGCEEVSVRGLAERLAQRVTGTRSTSLSYELAYPPGFEEVPRRRPDLTRARDWLGFVPSWSLDDILDQVADVTPSRAPAECDRPAAATLP